MTLSDQTIQYLGQMQQECLLANGKQPRGITVNAPGESCATGAVQPSTSLDLYPVAPTAAGDQQ